MPVVTGVSRRPRGAGDLLQRKKPKPCNNSFPFLKLLPLAPFSAKLSGAFCSEQQVKFSLCEHKAMKPLANNENKTHKKNPCLLFSGLEEQRAFPSVPGRLNTAPALLGKAP